VVDGVDTFPHLQLLPAWAQLSEESVEEDEASENTKENWTNRV